MTATVYLRSILPGTLDNTNDPSIVGHAWLEIHHPDGSVESLGFYPQSPAWSIDGKVKTDDASKYAGKGFTSDGVNISISQLQDLRLFALSTDASGNWTLPGYTVEGNGWNCATWGIAAFRYANVDAQFASGDIAPWFIPFLFEKDSFPSTTDIEGWPSIDSIVEGHYNSARNQPRPRDPLVLDLNGGGITTSALNTAAPILFDVDGDGIKTGTGWIGAGEAIVVRDLNGNGTIDSGRELFGDATVLTRGAIAGTEAANGFAALADLQRQKGPSKGSGLSI